MEINRTSATTPTPLADPSLAPKNTAGDAKGKPSEAETPSSLKSFAYGALDLEKPEHGTQDTDDAYSAGKWTGAAAKVGAIVSLLV